MYSLQNFNQPYSGSGIWNALNNCAPALPDSAASVPNITCLSSDGSTPPGTTANTMGNCSPGYSLSDQFGWNPWACASGNSGNPWGGSQFGSSALSSLFGNSSPSLGSSIFGSSPLASILGNFGGNNGISNPWGNPFQSGSNPLSDLFGVPIGSGITGSIFAGQGGIGSLYRSGSPFQSSPFSGGFSSQLLNTPLANFLGGLGNGDPNQRFSLRDLLNTPLGLLLANQKPATPPPVTAPPASTPPVTPPPVTQTTHPLPPVYALPVEEPPIEVCPGSQEPPIEVCPGSQEPPIEVGIVLIDDPVCSDAPEPPVIQYTPPVCVGVVIAEPPEEFIPPYDPPDPNLFNPPDCGTPEPPQSTPIELTPPPICVGVIAPVDQPVLIDLPPTETGATPIDNPIAPVDQTPVNPIHHFPLDPTLIQPIDATPWQPIDQPTLQPTPAYPTYYDEPVYNPGGGGFGYSLEENYLPYDKFSRFQNMV